MRCHEDGAAAAVSGNDVGKSLRACIVEPGHGLVEQQDRGIAQQGAGKRDPLQDAAREPAALIVADAGVEALRQRLDGLENAGFRRSRTQFRVGGARAGKTQVLSDRSVEQSRRLRHPADAAPEHGGIEGPDIVSVDPHQSALRPVEAGDQQQQGRLAGSLRARDGDDLTGLDREAGAGQHGLRLRHVAQGDALEDDGALLRRRHARLERRRTLRLQSHHSVDLTDRRLGLLPPGQHDEAGLHGTEDAPDQHHAGDQSAGRHGAGKDREHAHDDGCQPGEGHERLAGGQNRTGERADPRRSDGSRGGCAGIALDPAFLGTGELQGPHGFERFDRQGFPRLIGACRLLDRQPHRSPRNQDRG